MIVNRVIRHRKIHYQLCFCLILT